MIAQTWDGVPVEAVARVEVSTEELDFVLLVDATYHGDPAPDGPIGARDALWEHEVVEWFLVGSDGRYLEIELGPHGHHLVLQLDGVRSVVARCLPIAYQAVIDGDRWRGIARVPRRYAPIGPYRANAFAIHGVGAARRYLAMDALPGDKPDFHQPERFRRVEI